MPHKFVPRKGKGKDQASPSSPEPPPSELPPPEPMNDGPVPEEAAEDTADREVDTKPPVLKPGRSAKDSILKKLPAKGQKKSLLKLEPRKKDRPLPVAEERNLAPLVLVLCLVAGAAVTGGVFLLMMNSVPGYQASAAVTKPTRLDWIFVEEKESLEKAPPVMEMWEPTRQRFELYVPPDLDASQPAAAVLFLSPESRPQGWSFWQKICQDNKVIFIGPSNPSDKADLWQRTRAALDAFDEVRREHKIDPDRTYIVGHGGGAQAACRIAFALPELFGGLVAINGGDLPREEPWLRQRLLDRLSVALVTGSALKIEVDKLYKPLLTDWKIRCEVWEAGAGRGMPSPEILEQVYTWLEADLQRRQELGQRYPASRFPPDGAPSREEQAKLLLTEARQRLAKPETFVSGMAQLHGILLRWPKVPAGKEAFKQHQEFYIQENRPWVQEETLQRQARDLAMARALTAYLVAELEPAELERTSDRRHEWGNLALNLWGKLAGSFGAPKEIVDEAAKKTEQLKIARNQAFIPPPKDKDKEKDKDKDKKE